MKKLNTLMDVVIGVSVGTFVGRCLFLYLDYRANPGLYASGSAPWYTGMLVSGGLSALTILAALLIKYIIKNNNIK